jgi:hypothetical protein
MALRTENGWYQVSATQLDRSPIPGTNIVVPLQKGWPSIVLKAFAADFHAYVESLQNARGGTDEGGWTPTNSVATSNHLSGTAMDLNWSDHTFRVSYAGFNQLEIAVCRELLAFYTFEGLPMVFWGQDWNSPKDAMHFQMGYGTYNDQRVARFIAERIRPDGFSTFKRGGKTPSVPRKLVVPDAGGTFWTDVSQYQGKPIDGTCRDKVFSFRTNSGNHVDTLCLQNAKAAKALLDEGKLELVIPYYFFRPGQANCDLHRELLEKAGLWNHPRTVTMVDVEGDNGTVTGNNSWEVNDEINRVRGWYGEFGRVIGYLNPNADLGLWPTRAGINLVVPQYYRTPGDISSVRDSQAKADAIAHQFTDKATDVAPWTGQGVDRNWTPYSVPELLRLFGIVKSGGIFDMLNDEEQAELLKKTRELHSALLSKKRSRSIYADPEEGARWPWYELLENTDGMVHEVDAENGARHGNKPDIRRVLRTALGEGIVATEEAIEQAKSVLTQVPPEQLEQVEQEYRS